MSAYSVPDNQIHVMVSYIIKNSSKEFYIPPFSSIHVGDMLNPNMLNIQSIWDTLRRANDLSLNERYNDTGFSDSVPFICALNLPEPLHMYRIVDNFEYQACETQDWYTSKAKAICDAIRSMAVDKLIKKDETGHESIPWGFNDDISPDPYFFPPSLADSEVEAGKIYRIF